MHAITRQSSTFSEIKNRLGGLDMIIFTAEKLGRKAYIPGRIILNHKTATQH